MWLAFGLAALSNASFAIVGLMQKWLMNKTKISSLQLTLWTSLGIALLVLLHFSLIARQPEQIMFSDDLKYAPLFVFGIIILSLIGVLSLLYASKKATKPELLIAFVIVGVALTYGLGRVLFQRPQSVQAWVGIGIATIGMGTLAFSP